MSSDRHGLLDWRANLRSATTVVGTAITTYLAVAHLGVTRPAFAQGWQPVPGAQPVHDLAAPELDGLQRRRRSLTYHGDSGRVRSDDLVISLPTQPGLSANFELRTGSAAALFPSMLKQTLEAKYGLKGAVTTFSDQFATVETRYDTFRVLPFTATADGLMKRCLGFQTAAAVGASFLISGYVCDDANAVDQPRRLACLLDSLSLVGKLDQADAQATIAERLTRPAKCTFGPVEGGLSRTPRPANSL